MTSQQQALMLDALVAVRKALKRKAYDSDSDSSIEYNTNRGHKLQKKARFVRRGHLPQSLEPGVFKEVVEHGGYQRPIISRNAPLIDDDGYDIESDDDEESIQEAMAAAADFNPYANIHIEHLLAPLTSVTELPNHPTLSRPFTSKALTGLVSQGCNLMHQENAALWRVRPLLTRLQGDHTWVPCSMMIEPSDIYLFSGPSYARFPGSSAQASMTQGATTPLLNGGTERVAVSGGDARGGDREGTRNTPPREGANDADRDEGTAPEAGYRTVEASGNNKDDGGARNLDPERKGLGSLHDPRHERTEAENNMNGQAREGAGRPNGGRMEGNDETAERGRIDADMAEAPDEVGGQPGKPGNAGSYYTGSRAPSSSPSTADDLFIHPLFLAPRSAVPDRDQALPEQEAEDVRRLLQLYVQKQEEICRGTAKLYSGLLKADRYRKTVLQWAKAEAHCGDRRDMSDGEDWYDKEEWGLTEDLKKGQDEEEEDTAQTQKKTRNRK